MLYSAYFFDYSMLKIDTLGISLSCFYGDIPPFYNHILSDSSSSSNWCLEIHILQSRQTRREAAGVLLWLCRRNRRHWITPPFRRQGHAPGPPPNPSLWAWRGPPLRKPMRLECSWKKKYWVANTGLYLPPILTRDIFTTIWFSMRSVSPTTNTTIPTSAAITKYDGSVTDCAESMACPLSFPAGTRVRAKSGTKWAHCSQDRPASRTSEDTTGGKEIWHTSEECRYYAKKFYSTKRYNGAGTFVRRKRNDSTLNTNSYLSEKESLILITALQDLYADGE